MRVGKIIMDGRGFATIPISSVLFSNVKIIEFQEIKKNIITDSGELSKNNPIFILTCVSDLFDDIPDDEAPPKYNISFPETEHHTFKIAAVRQMEE